MWIEIRLLRNGQRQGYRLFISSVTITGGNAWGDVAFRTSKGTKLTVGYGTNTFQFAGVPENKQVNGDIHILTVSFPLNYSKLPHL